MKEEDVETGLSLRPELLEVTDNLATEDSAEVTEEDERIGARPELVAKSPARSMVGSGDGSL